ncbi:MAG: flagellar hook protein FlgE [Proteobacteria bacterium]|nr:flagellar hook protein FlgE [Pseudomonadota bacterium]MBU1059938.1 flagellar hook protein FlgE [Pseudomonadota bacterium]
MGITSALYSGVSGLNTNSQAMSVIGNNLANTNTLGFKGARTVFSDLLSSNISGSGGNSQVGRGVNVSKVDNIFSQGTFENTSSNTDVAIEGEGFFMLKEEGNDTTFYSRAGAFRFDADGFLINPEGYHVLGKAFDENGAILPGDPTDIQVENVGLVPAKVTDMITYNTNLDASEVPPVAAFDPTIPATYNYSASTAVFDTLGSSHLVTIYFVKDAVDNTWNWNWSAEDSDGGALGGAGATQIVFNEDGTLDDAIVGNGTGQIPVIDWLNGSTPTAIDVTFDTTQFNSASTVISQDQNGFAAGNLTNVGINAEGIVIASYSNGEQVKVSNLVLAKFNNPGGLEMVGSNMFISTGTSGVPRSGIPGPELGKIFTNSLEQSNVDMGQEFVKMITTQRGFQANSKIITTVDELLGELINLKR